MHNIRSIAEFNAMTLVELPVHPEFIIVKNVDNTLHHVALAQPMPENGFLENVFFVVDSCLVSEREAFDIIC